MCQGMWLVQIRRAPICALRGVIGIGSAFFCEHGLSRGTSERDVLVGVAGGGADGGVLTRAVDGRGEGRGTSCKGRTHIVVTSQLTFKIAIYKSLHRDNRVSTQVVCRPIPDNDRCQVNLDEVC